MKKYAPTAQMIAEADCNGICKTCDGRSVCWREEQDAVYLTPLEKEKVQACILYQEKRFELGEVEMSEEEREWAIDFYHELAKKFR